VGHRSFMAGLAKAAMVIRCQRAVKGGWVRCVPGAIGSLVGHQGEGLLEQKVRPSQTKKSDTAKG